MNMGNPKKRGSNYSESEKQLLLSLIDDYSYIIDNKETTAQFMRDKQEAWLHIETRYNALASTGRRTCLQLRRLYDNIKRKVRKDFAEDNKPKQIEENIQEIEMKASDDEKENYEADNAANHSQLSGTNNQVINNNCTGVSEHIERIARIKEEHFVQKLKNAKLERILLIAEHKRRESLFKVKLQLLKQKLNNQSIRIKNKYLSPISLE